MNWRDILERAAWTFAQGALGAVGTIPLLTDASGWATLAGAALVGGIGALASFLKTVAQERLGVLETRHDMITEGH